MNAPYMTTVRFSLLMIFCMASSVMQRALAAEKPVKVFILAGQSNMEGKGFPRPLAWQVSQPAYQERYQHLIQDSDCDAFVAALERSLSEDPKAPLYRWSSRSDVWVDFHDRHGDLSVGYSPNYETTPLHEGFQNQSRPYQVAAPHQGGPRRRHAQLTLHY